jgi:hypothetical protein
MRLTNAMPSVCSAIGSSKFEGLAAVTKTALTGPSNGANTFFTFQLVAKTLAENTLTQSGRVKSQTILHLPDRGLDLAGSIILVSCVKSKLPHPAPARALYTSTWFTKVRDLVEASGARWYILSSRYGLVKPDAEIAPYNYTLNTMGITERRQWASKVLDRLLPVLARERRVVMFAGQRYREFLIDPIRERGIEISVPMANLPRGSQLAWLCEQE